MNLSEWTKNVQTIKLQRNYSFCFNAFLSAMLLLSLLIIQRTTNSQTTVIVPAGLHEEVMVNSAGVSHSYLLQWTDFITNLRLNVTPETVAKNQNALLPYVSNKIYGTFKSEMVDEQEKIINGEISTVYYPKDTKVIDIKGGKARSTGLLKVYIGDNLHESVKVTYDLEFEYANNKLLLKSFAEVARV